VDIILNEVEARVLGSLIEKGITTPDYYPLSLNALMNACNQKSNREPVMDLDEDTVQQAIRGLEKQGLAGPADNFDSRVKKYEHRLQEAFNFDRRETAVICTLLLRGPQTPGELRSRSERLHPFDELSEVELTLQRLMQRNPSLVKVLPRQPGTKEARYVHLLSGDVEVAQTVAPAFAPAPHNTARSNDSVREDSGRVETGRMAQVEQQVTELQDEIAGLKRQFADFRKQFE
jgi:uncharacterized protein YceH (UPF0502 family)